MRRLKEKEIPKERQVGNAGGTLIVTKSRRRIMTSSFSIYPRSYLSRKVLIDAKKDIRATDAKMRMNFPESLSKEIWLWCFGYMIERIRFPFKVSNPTLMTWHSVFFETY